MGKNKKRFIDKKNSITFTLVHRSQKDPLLVDESAPQHVLKPIQSQNTRDKTKVKEEQRKYGIYFDDEYDYLQHLRDRGENPVEMERVFIPARSSKNNSHLNNITEALNTPSSRLQLPSSVFASEFEESVGMLNKAAPQSGLRLDLDPDIVAAMDEDFDFDDPDNRLDDDFVMKAQGGEGGDFEDINEEDEGDSDDYEDMSSDFDPDDEERDEFDENNEKMFAREETKSRFTEYSMSSSVMRRNENLTYLDDTFETMFSKYNDTEIGALECEDIEGDILTNDQRLLSVAEEFEKERQVEKFNTEKIGNQYGRMGEDSSEESSEEDDYERMVVREKEKWDCESILSTYSNIYNHPTLIKEEPKSNKIKINPKTGIPIVPVSTKLTPSLLAHHDYMHPGTEPSDVKRGPGSVISAISTLSIRPKGETPEERKMRKNNLKDFRKERRIEKKANKLAFRDEKKRVERAFINKKVSATGIHL
uniref:Protein LTV1 homolog n=1 Tax=Cacopsylla melanoneura TaxID=428564 RepID=A0A8D8LRU0_9HEMI